MNEDILLTDEQMREIQKAVLQRSIEIGLPTLKVDPAVNKAIALAQHEKSYAAGRQEMIKWLEAIGIGEGYANLSKPPSPIWFKFPWSYWQAKRREVLGE